MSDLFNWRASYPNQPGYRRTKTSRAAAAAVKERAPNLRDQVLRLLKETDNGLTADECAERIGKSILSIRPRVTELKRLGKIYDTELTRPNASGVQASVWKAWP